MERDSRDRSPVANKVYEAPVPKELMDYLQQHKDSLIPEFRKVWEKAGFKTSGTWEQVFGKGTSPDEIFMAWNFGRYVGRVAEAGKAEYPIPMYANAWLYGFAKPDQRPNSQSGSPMPDVMDVWRAGAPKIDLLGPDIYGFDFVVMCANYTQSGNPLFIPEGPGGAVAATRVLYAFGHHDAIGISPFGIDTTVGRDPEFAHIYDLLSRLSPLILEHQGKGTMSAVLLDPNDAPQKVQVGNYTLTGARIVPRAMPGVAPPPQTERSGAIFIATGPDEYFAAGSGVTVTFSPNTPGPPLAGLATVEEGELVNGRWVPSRRLAGDDDGQGQHLDLRTMGIQHFTLYRYK
jgi:hypothetical protein